MRFNLGTNNSPEGERLSKVLARFKVSLTTGWRLRNGGWLHVCKIAGRPYVMREDAQTFFDRICRDECGRLPKPREAQEGA